MNKPVEIETARVEPVVPAVAIPSVPNAAPAPLRSRKVWLIGGLLGFAVIVAGAAI